MKPIFAKLSFAAALTLGLPGFVPMPTLAQQPGGSGSPDAQKKGDDSALANPFAAMAKMQAAAAAKIKEAASQPTPRTADGHPDLSGYWVPPVDFLAVLTAGSQLPPSGSTTKPLVGSETQEHAGNLAGVAARKANKSSRPSYKPEFQAKADDYFDRAAFLDPSYRCEPLGVPRMGAPAEIVQTPTAVYFLYANLVSVPNPYRVIPLDGRPHNKDAEPLANGDAVGHWEGDTLVIDVTNFGDSTWIDGDGSFHDGNMHVVERLTRQGNSLRYEFTVDDPTLFTKPFTPPTPTMLVLGKPGDHPGEDYPCVEMDQNYLKTNERH